MFVKPLGNVHENAGEGRGGISANDLKSISVKWVFTLSQFPYAGEEIYIKYEVV